MMETPRMRHSNNAVIANVHITCSRNNIFAVLAAPPKGVLCKCSPGILGFGGSKKTTPYAAQQMGDFIGRRARDDFGISIVHIHFRGINSSRDSVVMAIDECDIKIQSLRDHTSIPYNGCRQKKRRRV